ncbi:MAG: ftsA [Rickettsiales bacterium]|jgi:cell division protein FtsA|nr:ftsA [Rickettsiales bacterium]
MTKHKPRLFAVLDLGSTKIACFIAQINPARQLEVIGIGHQVSQGIRAGVITDIRAAETAILSAVHAAEQMADVNIEQVYVSISGSKVASHTVSVEQQIQGREITPRDIERIIQEGYGRFSEGNQEVVHCLPVDYVLDGETGISDPRGMFGDVLTTRMHTVTTTSTSLLNITNCLARCQLDIAECIVSPYASGLACLTDDERHLGATLLDMGGGHTSISVFRDGDMIHTDSVGLGGIHVTSDIAWGLSTNLASAERIKTLYGNLIQADVDRRDMIEVPQMGEEEVESRQFSRVELGDILRPRVEEIFDLVKRRLETRGIDRRALGRIVLTGGASQLGGMKELASYMFNKQVRVAAPRPLPGLAESTKGPAFSTSVGILQYVADKTDDMTYTNPTAGLSGKTVNRMMGWIKENF